MHLSYVVVILFCLYIRTPSISRSLCKCPLQTHVDPYSFSHLYRFVCQYLVFAITFRARQSRSKSKCFIRIECFGTPLNSGDCELQINPGSDSVLQSIIFFRVPFHSIFTVLLVKQMRMLFGRLQKCGIYRSSDGFLCYFHRSDRKIREIEIFIQKRKHHLKRYSSGYFVEKWGEFGPFLKILHLPMFAICSRIQNVMEIRDEVKKRHTLSVICHIICSIDGESLQGMSHLASTLIYNRCIHINHTPCALDKIESIVSNKYRITRHGEIHRDNIQIFTVPHRISPI